MRRYEIKFDEKKADQWMILDTKTGDAIGFVHSGFVAAQCVNELNKMEKKGA